MSIELGVQSSSTGLMGLRHHLMGPELIGLEAQ